MEINFTRGFLLQVLKNPWLNRVPAQRNKLYDNSLTKRAILKMKGEK
jgi:hypothetical protein